MRPLRAVFVGIALLVALSACGNSSDSGSGEPQPTLAGSSWILTEVAIEGTMTAAVDSSGSLNFDADGSMYGSTGCNRFSGTWTAEGNDLTLQTGPMTLMGCPPELQSQELAVLAALTTTQGYTIADDVLTLTGADDLVLASYKAAVTDVADTSWTATGVNNGAGGVVTTANTSALTLTFTGDGAVSGFGGCTDFTGSYTVDGAAITITGLQPKQPCTDSALAPQQDEYLAALAAATNFSIDGTRLDLRDESGALQAGFSSVS